MKIATQPDDHLKAFLRANGVDPTRLTELRIEWEASRPVVITATLYATAQPKDVAA